MEPAHDPFGDAFGEATTDPRAAPRPKLAKLADHARTNAQVDVLTLVRSMLTDLEAQEAAGTPLPTSAFFLLGDKLPSGWTIDYYRARLTAEDEAYLLHQALLKRLLG